MTVVTQGGREIENVYEAQMTWTKIEAVFPERENILLGTYADLQRACEVMGELTSAGWNTKDGRYVMPAV